MSRKVLIVTGDGGDSYEALYRLPAVPGGRLGAGDAPHRRGGGCTW